MLLNQHLKTSQLMGNIKGKRRKFSLKVLISSPCRLLPFLPFSKPNGSSQRARSLVWVEQNEKSLFGIQSSAESTQIGLVFIISITKYSSLHLFPIKLDGTMPRRAWVEPENLSDYFKVLKLVGLAFTWLSEWAQLILRSWEESEILPYLQVHKLACFSLLV